MVRAFFESYCLNNLGRAQECVFFRRSTHQIVFFKILLWMYIYVFLGISLCILWIIFVSFVVYLVRGGKACLPLVLFVFGWFRFGLPALLCSAYFVHRFVCTSWLVGLVLLPLLFVYHKTGLCGLVFSSRYTFQRSVIFLPLFPFSFKITQARS